MQLAEHLSAQSILRKHTFYSVLDNSFGVCFQHFVQSCFFQTACPTGVVTIHFLFQLFACNSNFFCIHNNNIVAHVSIGCILRFVFPSQNRCNFGSQTAQCYAFSVNHVPLFYDVRFFSDVSSSHGFYLLSYYFVWPVDFAATQERIRSISIMRKTHNLLGPTLRNIYLKLISALKSY